ncbi:MAG: hypothetical protein JWO82_3915 [Akkermansiaceae bacterium]|nr:hypothetical protein [Akkermansiaceae bacterium]
MISSAFAALICLGASFLFGFAGAGAFTTGNYDVSAVCLVFSIACFVWGCIEARGCRRGF